MIEKLYALMFALTAPRDEEKGATAVEYGLLVTVIALAIIVGMTALAGGLNGMFNNAANAL